MKEPWNFSAVKMQKFIQLGEKFGLEGEKLLEFVREQEEKEDKRRDEERDEKRREEEREEKRRQLEEEREEKRRRFEEEKEERRRMLEEDKRKEEEEKEERRRREDEERETRRQERELRKLEMEAELMKQKEAIEAAKREHELEIARLAVENADGGPVVREDRAKAPKLPFVDGKDDLDAYLQRFERFAETAKWKKDGWASKLSALLSRRALEVYSRLSEDTAKDYDRVKIALMKRYDLTEDGYRRKFRASKPEVDESPEQLIGQIPVTVARAFEYCANL